MQTCSEGLWLWTDTFCNVEAIDVCKQPTSIKHKLKNWSPSGNTHFSPDEKRLRECKKSEEECHGSDNGVEASQEVQELDKN